MTLDRLLKFAPFPAGAANRLRLAVVVAGALLLTSPASARHASGPAGQPGQTDTAPSPPLVTSEKPTASGAYKDSGGAVHQWDVDSGHMLTWDGRPYLPVGGVFEPHYWVDGQTPASWDADVAALGALKQNHVQ